VLVSDETGRAHQVCKSHVGRNTDALVEELSALIHAGQDRSLEIIHVSSEQALADLTKASALRLPIGCGICSWIVGTYGRASLFIELGKMNLSNELRIDAAGGM